MGFQDPSSWRDFFSKIFDVIFHSPRFAIFLFLVSGSLLFWDGMIDKLSLTSFRNQYRVIISLTLLISVCLLISYLIVNLYQRISAIIVKKAQERRNILFLKNHLSPKQKGVLYEFIRSNERTLAFHIDNRVASELENEGILYRTTEFTDAGGYMNFSIDSSVWNFIKEHTGILLVK